MIHNLFVFCIFIFIFFACEGKKEDVPAYLHIEKIGLKLDPAFIEGSNDSKITDAKIFVNDQILGIFELPVNLPILNAGNVELKISPVIKNNGVSNDRIVYPFYNDFSTTINLIPGVLNEFPTAANVANQNGINYPLIEYFHGSYEFFIEDFESGYNFDSIQGNDISDVSIEKIGIDSLVYSNGDLFSGEILVNSSNPHFFIVNSLQRKINKNFKLYLELNYRTNCKVQVGLYQIVPSVTKVYLGKGINESEQWNKIYIDLTNEVNFASSGTEFKYYFEGDKPTDSDGYLYIDNVKLIYLKDE
jgi:hypothetical protein